MAFSAYEVVRVACQSRSHAHDFVNAKSHARLREKPLLAEYNPPYRVNTTN